MAILMLLYKSALDIDQVKQLFRERLRHYRAVDGLRQKLYVHDPITGEVGGIYIFETAADLDAFRRSDLERSVKRVYQFNEPPEIRIFELIEALFTPEAPALAAEPDSKRSTFRHVIDEAFNRGNLTTLDACCGPGYVDHQDGVAPATLDGVKAFITRARAAFPDLHLTIDELSVNGDRLWARTTVRGTHRGTFMGIPASGRRFAVVRFDICQFADEKIVEHWGVVDRLSLLRQIAPSKAA